MMCNMCRLFPTIHCLVRSGCTLKDASCWLQLLEGGERVDAANEKLASGAANGVDNAIAQASSCTGGSRS